MLVIFQVLLHTGYVFLWMSLCVKSIEFENIKAHLMLFEQAFGHVYFCDKKLSWKSLHKNFTSNEER